MTCPYPGCSGAVPHRSIFCDQHYFRLPRRQAGLIFQVDFKCERAATFEDKAYFEGQKQGYIAQAVRTLQSQSPVCNSSASNSSASPCRDSQPQPRPNFGQNAAVRS